VVSGTVTTTFTYDGDGNLVKKVAPAGTTLYVGPHYEVQPLPASPPQPPSSLPKRAFLPLIFNNYLTVDGQPAQIVKYYVVGGQRIASRTGSTGPVTYYYHDHLGSTVGSSGESTRARAIGRMARRAAPAWARPINSPSSGVRRRWDCTSIKRDGGDRRWSNRFRQDGFSRAESCQALCCGPAPTDRVWRIP
jgi:hypothetical protein